MPISTVRSQRHSNPHPWLACLVNWLGIKDVGFDMVLYDLGSETAVNIIRDVEWAQFSSDGSSLAVIANDTLSVYDFPLRKPWLKIATWGFAAASVWLLAWFVGRRRRRAA